MSQPDREPEDELPPDPVTPLREAGGNYNELFLALQASGFTGEQAFELVRVAVNAAFGGRL